MINWDKLSAREVRERGRYITSELNSNEKYGRSA
jgi:hypothetical protein